MRGFPPSDEPYLLKFRVKPSAPLIKMVIDRTKAYSHKEHIKKQEPYNRMSVALATNGFFVPGYAWTDRSYWLCPVVMPNRELFKYFCEAQGVFCYMRSTQICVVDMPQHLIDQGLSPPNNCLKFFKNVLYLPVNLSVPKR